MAPKPKPKRKEPDSPQSPPRTRTAFRSAMSSAMRVTRSAAASGSHLFPGVLPTTRKTNKKAKHEGERVKLGVVVEDENQLRLPSSSSSAAGAASSSSEPKKIIIIEHCLQSDKFLTRANEVKEALEPKVPGLAVLLNPDKRPRKGCFEIREEGGSRRKFFTLLRLKEPFVALNGMDINNIVKEITEALDEDIIASEISKMDIDP